MTQELAVPYPHLLRADEAAQLECPIARTFHERKSSKCMAGQCMLWRWRLMADGRFQSAVKREQALIEQEAEEKGEKAKNAHSKAATRVSQDPWRYIIPSPDDKGYCGLGGDPRSA